MVNMTLKLKINQLTQHPTAILNKSKEIANRTIFSRFLNQTQSLSIETIVRQTSFFRVSRTKSGCVSLLISQTQYFIFNDKRWKILNYEFVCKICRQVFFVSHHLISLMNVSDIASFGFYLSRNFIQALYPCQFFVCCCHECFNEH